MKTHHPYGGFDTNEAAAAYYRNHPTTRTPMKPTPISDLTCEEALPIILALIPADTKMPADHAALVSLAKSLSQFTGHREYHCEQALEAFLTKKFTCALLLHLTEFLPASFNQRHAVLTPVMKLPGTLFLSPDFRTMRVTVSGSYPKDDQGCSCVSREDESKCPRRTYAMDRDPQAIAQDIRRNVTPEFHRIAAAAEASRLSRAAYANSEEAITQEFAKALGCDYTPGKETLRLHTQAHGVSGTVRVCTPDSIYFTLDGMTPAKARKLVALLKTLAH